MRISDIWYFAWRRNVSMLKQEALAFQYPAAIAQAEYVMAIALELVHGKSK